MEELLEFIKFFLDFDASNLSVKHITVAGVFTIVMYFLLFIVRKFIKKQAISFVFLDFFTKWGIAFVVEFTIIWLYGPRMTILSVVLGMLTALYVRNKFFTFIDTTQVPEQDLKLRTELMELKNKFKKNPYYSILEVLLYYGYISNIQKETIEADNIFKTPDEMAKEFLSKPILTEEQLDEAIGIMNVIRREGKILTREEALLLIMNMGAEHPVREKNNSDPIVTFVQDENLLNSLQADDEENDNQDVGD